MLVVEMSPAVSLRESPNISVYSDATDALGSKFCLTAQHGEIAAHLWIALEPVSHYRRDGRKTQCGQALYCDGANFPSVVSPSPTDIGFGKIWASGRPDQRP